MAITKILHINEVDMGNPARHLEQALDYIQNPEKTNGNVLVGSINCLPETAFEQMMDTKMTFGKMDKRQGYHIIISFVPRETTEEIAFDIVERFAKEQNFSQTIIQTDDTGTSCTVYALYFWKRWNKWDQRCDRDCACIDFTWFLCDFADSPHACF